MHKMILPSQGKNPSSLQAIPMPIRIFQIPKIKAYHAQKTFIFQFLSANTQKTKLQIIKIYLKEGTALLKYLTLNRVHKKKKITK